ncbi:MAG TPA: VWA domain-containing protein, partial [Gammaproteobacteria bacterium]|nr:VWA domain-containing protein [Gammaproteobacteria bacterium]
IYLLLAFKTSFNDKNWQSVIDPQLMPFVLSKSGGKRRRYPLLLVFIAASLCITALAGPVYKKLPQPVYREQSALVVLLDLSQSMNATDIKPSRLARTKLKLLDLLKTRKTGQTALIVYAADAFVVTPLTDDNATIANLVPSLETTMMPAQGSNLSNALAKTVSLFSQAGIIKGDILVMTDGIHARDEDAIKKITSQGHQLSIFGIGTTTGSPIPITDSEQGGFLLDDNNAIVIPKLEPEKLQRYALEGGGLYISLQADDSDINKLVRLFESKNLKRENDINGPQERNDSGTDNSADLWQEEGHWLLLPLLFLAALWARKGWIAAVTFFVLSFVQPVYQPLYAAAIDTDHLWLSADQSAMKAFDEGDNDTAAENFTRPEWKASAYYRNKNFEAAAETLEGTKSSDGFYNLGNALARQGKYEEAIKAYDKALELNEKNADATYNRDQVEQALKKQEKDQKQQQGQNQDDKEKGDQKQDQDEQEQQDQDQQDKNQKNQDQQDKKQQPSGKQGQQEDNPDNKDSEQPSSDTEKSQSEEQKTDDELKQRDAEEEKKQQEQEKREYEKNKNQQDNKNPDKEKDKSKEQKQQEQQQDTEDKPVENKDSEEKPAEVEVNPTEASITEDEKATEQWLKRVPDDPGGLLRRKFLYQYKQLPDQHDDKEPW